jgi:nucleoside-diphosphate-sugar epimerase
MAEKIRSRELLLLGATSQVGVFAIPRLLAAGYRVCAVSRKPEPPGYGDHAGLSWMQPGDYASSAASFLLSCGPTGLAAEAASRLPRLKRAVVFSTSSVISKQRSPDTEERRQMQAIAGAEDSLRQRCAVRHIGLCLLRPTLIYGCGLDENVSRLARWLRRLGFLPIADDAPGLRQPVHADDLAQAAVAALACENSEPLELFLCGGSTVSYRRMITLIGQGIGVRPRLLKLPPAGLEAAAALAGRLPGLGGFGPAMVRRQAVDLVFDDSAARELLGFAPRPFAPGADDFCLPDPAVLLARARDESGPRSGGH